MPETALSPSQIRCVLWDLEGTIVPMDFVHRTLFPYASAGLDSYLSSPEAGELAPGWLGALRAEASQMRWPEGAPVWESVAEGGAEDLRAAAPLLQWLISHDIKSPVLKAIQGRIWRRGYEAGQLQGELFSGVASGLRNLHGRGVRLAIYSSGSVEAQRLLLGYSTKGDLRPLISDWFDTGVGPKTDSQSYVRVAESLGLAPASILFATDHLGEAAAAGTAGMPVALSLRGVTKPGEVAGLVPAPVLAVEDVMRGVVELNLGAPE